MLRMLLHKTGMMEKYKTGANSMKVIEISRINFLINREIARHKNAYYDIPNEFIQKYSEGYVEGLSKVKELIDYLDKAEEDYPGAGY